MMRIDLRVELLTDVSVSASNRSLGDAGALDYLPGRLFWGAAAAAAYPEKGSPCPDPELDAIFLGGSVRFLDAVFELDGQRAYPTPRSWHAGKYEEKPSRALNLAHDETRRAQQGQLEPLGGGWRLPDGRTISAAMRYGLRTAMTASGKPEQGMLFGMESLPAGTLLHGAIEAGDPKVLGQVKGWLLGDKRLGRSRGAEYGLVRITEAAHPAQPLDSAQGRVCRISILVCSRLGLRAESTGQPRLVPLAKDFELPDDWSFVQAASFVRTSRYAPFSGVRRRPETERQVIDPGCVLTFAGSTAVELTTQRSKLRGGVGLWRAEGHGEVVLAPTWLTEGIISLPAAEPPRQKAPSVKLERPGDELFAWATARDEQRRAHWQSAASVTEDFLQLEDFRLPASQWGVLHRLAREAAFSAAARARLPIRLREVTEEGVSATAVAWGRRRRGETAARTLRRLCEERSHDPRWLELLASYGMREAPAGVEEDAR
ncbi:MAG: hypothetical protein FJ125_15620 [Deltaproteobacteria bacterium]|nr:hypothetical protein [Deltaproteobacteria bacterium]